MHDVLVGRHGYNVVSDRTALMCLVGLLGLITPRLILILMWLFSPEFVLQPFADLPIPNPIMLVLGLVVGALPELPELPSARQSQGLSPLACPAHHQRL